MYNVTYTVNDLQCRQFLTGGSVLEKLALPPLSFAKFLHVISRTSDK